MISNDVLRSMRFMLNVGDSKLSEIIRLGGGNVAPMQVAGFLKREEEPGFVLCDAKTMGQFLDGLIVDRRGQPPAGQTHVAENHVTKNHVTNNTVLKKLRVAFELRDDDLIAMLKSAGFEVSKPELTALFRKSDHRNYRPCGDQFLRNFLKALTARVRRGAQETGKVE
jgi:uncharacterized protein YehS (DUF1456 family)